MQVGVEDRFGRTYVEISLTTTRLTPVRPFPRLALTLTLLAACDHARAQPATPPQAAPPLEALDAIVRGPTLYAVDPSGRTLRAIALDTGAVRFTTPLGQAESHALISELGQSRLLVQTPHRFVTVDTTNGNVVHTRDLAMPWSFVWRAAGACALRSECTFEPIDCRTGAPLGPPLRGTYSHRMPIEPSDDAGEHCESDFDVIGRAGELSLYLVGPLSSPNARSREDPRASQTREVIAIHDSGATRWRSTEVGCASCTRHGFGVASDGSLCWTSESGGMSSELKAFDCASGQKRFSQRLQHPRPYRDPELLTAWVPGRGLFALDAARVRLFAPNGRVLWSRAAAADHALVPSGALFPPYAIEIPGLRVIEHVDAANGATLRTEAADGRVIRIGPDGTLSFTAGLRGGERGGGDPGPITRFTFERARTQSRALVNGRAVLTIAGDAVALGELAGETQSVLAVAEYRGERPDRIHLVRVPR